LSVLSVFIFLLVAFSTSAFHSWKHSWFWECVPRST